jgi:hypothetical protein
VEAVPERVIREAVEDRYPGALVEIRSLPGETRVFIRPGDGQPASPPRHAGTELVLGEGGGPLTSYLLDGRL